MVQSSAITSVRTEPAKKVTTFDLAGSENGFLIEMFKSPDGRKTEVYLSAANPGAFKGYHLHRVRAARYICLRGRMRIILYVPDDSSGKRVVINMDENLGADEVRYNCIDKRGAPVALDLVLLVDMAQRAGMGGIQEWLSFFFKSPHASFPFLFSHSSADSLFH